MNSVNGMASVVTRIVADVMAMLGHSAYLSAALLSSFGLLALEAWWVRASHRGQDVGSSHDVESGSGDER